MLWTGSDPHFPPGLSAELSESSPTPLPPHCHPAATPLLLSWSLLGNRTAACRSRLSRASAKSARKLATKYAEYFSLSCHFHPPNCSLQLSPEKAVLPWLTEA